jgi:adenine-specific DNA-methyltransferase
LVGSPALCILSRIKTCIQALLELSHWSGDALSCKLLGIEEDMTNAVPQDSNIVSLRRHVKFDIRCQDNIEFMRAQRKGSFHLIVTSPPYNVGKEYEKKAPLDKYVEEQAATIAEAVRLLHPNGSICWQVGNHVDDGEIFPLDVVLYPLFKNHGLQLRNRLVWTFGHGLHCQNRFSGRHETILWFTKSDDYIFNLDPVRVPSKYPEKKHFKGPRKGELSGNPLGKNPSDVWDIPNVKNNHVEKTDHPCQFPVGLVERLVLSLTNPGQNILDPYLGVGSSAIAALKNGRNAYGCDIIQEYVDIAHKRIDQFNKGELRVRPMNKPVYEPPMKERG